MKVGVLAGHLKLSAEELLTSLSLETSMEEVPDEKAIELISTREKSEGKKEGFKWGEKDTFTKVEQRLKEVTGLTGDFETIITGLKPVEIDKKGMIYKEKYDLLQAEFDAYKEKESIKEKRETIEKKAAPIFDKFLGKDELKKVVLKNVLEGLTTEVDGDDILLLDANKSPLKIGGKYADFGTFIESEFEKHFEKNTKKNFPKGGEGEGEKEKGALSFDDMNAALDALRKSKTPDEKTLIQKWIEKNS